MIPASTYDIRIRIANADCKLLPGMVANVRFVSDGSQAIGSKMVPVTGQRVVLDWSVTK